MSPNPDCVTEEKLICFAEGSLPAEEARSIEAHVATCAKCRETLDWLQQRLLRELESDDEAILRDETALSHPEATRASAAGPGPSDLDDELSATTESLGKFNDYEIIRVLGRGGFGVVYQAFDKVLNRHVAIKVLLRDLANQALSRRRFIREARAGAAINHPNVVTIHGVDEAGDTPFLIMELIQGESLRERIRRQPKLDFLDVLRISAQVAQGLAAAHAQGIIHRDVKPGNIMLIDSLPRVKITDFGLARVMVENLEFTSRGLTAGTPAYMSPEQVRGEELDTRSDLFALGCVMYAMLAGHSPFHGRTTLDIARRVADFQPPPLAQSHQVPEFLSQCVQRLLEKDPEKRFQSAAEVADVLNRHLTVLNQTPTDRLPQALRAQLVQPRRRALRWRQVLSGIALAVICAGIGLGLIYSRQGLHEAPANSNTAGSSETAAAGEGEHLPLPAGPQERKVAVTVAKVGAADCTTIGEALRQVAPGGTVTVLDAAEYVEPIRLEDAALHAGIKLVAATGATLRAGARLPVLQLRGIPDFRMEGFKIVAPQGQFGIEINGDCPGLQLQRLQIERVANADGLGSSVAAVVLRSGAAGTAERPIVLRGLVLMKTNVGIVIGNPDTKDPPPRQIVIEESLVLGVSRDTSTLLALLRQCENLFIRRNIFAEGMIGLSVVAEDDAQPGECELAHNTWHATKTWLAWTGPISGSPKLQIHNNLIVDSRLISPQARSLASATPSVFANNLLFNPQPVGADDFSPLAVTFAEIPLLSLAAADANYLKPDFARLRASGAPGPSPFPGRYSDE